MNLDNALTHREFGDLVGVSKQAVGQMVADGSLSKGENGCAWLLAYCARLRGHAAGRSSPESLASLRATRELVVSRTLAQNIKNAAAQMQYAPMPLLTQVLNRTAQAAGMSLDALVPTLAREGVDLSEAQRARVAQIVARSRSEFLARATKTTLLALLDDQLCRDQDDEHTHPMTSPTE